MIDSGEHGDRMKESDVSETSNPREVNTEVT